MNQNLTKNISECHFDLKNQGFFLSSIGLPQQLLVQVENENYNAIDKIITNLVSTKGEIFTFLRQFCAVKTIEHIISLRESKNEWEEDGIWHDDGSRILAFSLSLTLEPPKKGGVLEFRKKGSKKIHSIPTPNHGSIIVFKTGIDGFEHKINKVENGKRLIIAGWCYSTNYNASSPHF